MGIGVVAVFVGLTVSYYAELAPGGPQPDVLNYAWRDYGNRVGVFRLADLFAELKLPVSLLVNAEMYRHAPEAISAFPGAEIIGHGRSNSERQGDLTEYKERLLIQETTAAVEKHTGKRPRGWLGPWISQSPLTPDLQLDVGHDGVAVLIPFHEAREYENGRIGYHYYVSRSIASRNSHCQAPEARATSTDP